MSFRDIPESARARVSCETVDNIRSLVRAYDGIPVAYGRRNPIIPPKTLATASVSYRKRYGVVGNRALRTITKPPPLALTKSHVWD